MPSLSDTLRSDAPAGYSPVSALDTPVLRPSPIVQLTPLANGLIRCPIPPIYQTNPDSVRQFDLGGKLPQIRIYAKSLVK